jgi:hypothetical protein
MADITCKHCIYGRDLLGNDYGCRNEERIATNKEDKSVKLVNKKDYSCVLAKQNDEISQQENTD